jgi:hypothetical protein
MKEDEATGFTFQLYPMKNVSTVFARKTAEAGSIDYAAANGEP